MSKPDSGIRTKKIFIWTIRVIIVQLVFINISAAFHAKRLTHFYSHMSARNISSSKGKIFLRTWRMMVGRKYPKSVLSYRPAMPFDTVSLQLKNGNMIRAWYLKKDSATGTVILFHGLNSNKGDMLSEAEAFLDLGYDVFMPDIRAHGESDGEVNSLGVKESEEVKLAYDYISGLGEKNIIFSGMSMGAVIIAKAIYDYNLKPHKVILEMPFDRLQDHIRARARTAGFPAEPFGFFVTGWIGIEQGYWGFGHKTSTYVRSITCPVLLQWGAEDEFVKRYETENIFSGIGSKKKNLVVYEHSWHAPLIWKERDKWIITINDFLNHN